MRPCRRGRAGASEVKHGAFPLDKRSIERFCTGSVDDGDLSYPVSLAGYE